MASVASNAIRGTIMSVLSVGGSMGIRLATNIFMTRLLSPEMYGQMALLVAVDIGLRMLSDVGTYFVIINHPKGDEPRFMDTVFTVEVVRGIAMWVVALLISWPYANYVAMQPELATVLPIFALSTIINGFTSSNVNLLKREMKYGLLTISEVGEQVVASGVSILYALFIERSLWALVAGTLFAAIARTVFSHLFIPGPRSRFAWDKTVLHQLEGHWIFLSTALTYFAQRFDIFITPRLLTIGQIGVYNQANVLAQMPLFVGARIVGTVFMPAMSKVLRENPAAHPAKYLQGMYVVLLGGGVACLAVALASPSFFYILYDVRYHDAMWLCPLLVAAAWPHYLMEAAIREMLALGINRALPVANAARLAGTIVFSVLGYYVGGLVGFVLGNAVGAGCGAAYGAMVLRKQGLDAGPLEIKFTLVFVSVAAVGVAIPHALAPHLGINFAWVSMVSAVLIGIPTLLFTWKQFKLKKAEVMADS